MGPTLHLYNASIGHRIPSVHDMWYSESTKYGPISCLVGASLRFV